MSAAAPPRAAAPVARPAPPVAAIPPGACDAHVHMVADDYPLSERRVEDPAPGTLDAWVSRLETHLDALGMARVVIVHSILYGGDNAVTTAAVSALGDRARGIGLVRDGASDAELRALAEAGVVGVRLNYVHGGLLSWEGVREMAPRLAAHGLHVQMLMNADRHMSDLVEDVRALPVPVVFDHLGWPDLAAGGTEPGFAALRALVADGDAYVKLSAPYRLCEAPYGRAASAVADLVAANPDRCLWGSDWPHLMLAEAQQPDAGDLLNAFLAAVPSEEDRRRVLVDTPMALYGF